MAICSPPPRTWSGWGGRRGGLGNWWRFGSPFDLGYQRVDQSGSFVDGFVGQLLNPGKGLVFYAPIAVIAALRASDDRVARLGDLRRSACVLGFVDARFAEWGQTREYTEQQEYDRMLTALRGELGIELDDAANTARGPRISTPRSKASGWVIPTNEELMIARHTRSLLGL